MRLTPMPDGTSLPPIRAKGALTPPPAITPPMRAKKLGTLGDGDAVGTIVLEDTLSRTDARVSGRGSETSPERHARRSRLPLIVGAVAIIAGVVAIIVLAPVIFSPAPIQPTAMMRTPFTAAQVRFSREEDFSYSITIPNGFEFVELTNDEGVIHIWQQGLEAYIGLIVRHPRSLPSVSDANTDAERLHAAMDDYARTHYPPNAFTLIDEVTSGSTVRRSYRLEGEIDPPFPYGQTDAFFHMAGERLVVLELYTADGQDESQVLIFQQVLESLEIQFDNGVRLS